MSKRKNFIAQVKMKLTKEQREIINKVPNSATHIRNYIRNLKDEEVENTKTCNYSLNLTEECWYKLRKVKNKSELIRRYIDNQLKQKV